MYDCGALGGGKGLLVAYSTKPGGLWIKKHVCKKKLEEIIRKGVNIYIHKGYEINVKRMKVKRKFLIKERTKLYGERSKLLLICRIKYNNVVCQCNIMRRINRIN